MADQREYVIFATFDGTTEATELMPWSAGSGVGNQADQRFRTLETAAAIGRFPRRILGRESTHSLVRVWGDAPVLGDIVQVIGSAVSSPLEANPISQPRGPAVAIATGPQLAPILELDMTDQLTVTTNARISVHIEVLDLDEAQHLAWVLAKWKTDNACCGDTETETREIEVPEAGIELDSWTADVLYVEASSEGAEVGGELTLPLLTSVPLGAKVRISRTANSQFFFIGAQAGDPINGSGINKILMGAETSAAWIERSALGWTSTAPGVDLNPIPVTNSTSLSAPNGERTRILWSMTADAKVLTLPDIELVAVGQEFEITVVALTGGFARGGEVRPAVGQRLDGVVDLHIPVARVGDTVIVRRVAPTGDVANAGWVSYSNCAYVARNLETAIADPALGAHPGWRGVRTYIAEYEANGNFTLPANPMVGTEINIVRTSVAATVLLDAGVYTIITGTAAATTFALAVNVPKRLIFVTEDGNGFWIG